MTEQTQTDQAEGCCASGIYMIDPPKECMEGKGGGVIIGIDEAGRGPVLGPMIYGAAYWSVADDKEIQAMGFDDSKALTEQQREALFERIHAEPRIGWVIRVLGAQELSQKMLRKTPYSLNAISHDAAIEMVRAVQARGVVVTQAYVDTVGDPEMYQAKLHTEFGSDGPTFKVAKKADSLYKSVSAASICAKVTRDHIVSRWIWNEPRITSDDRDYGSGYPSDAKCVGWLQRNLEPTFGYPDLLRFSWAGAARDLLVKKGRKVEWPIDDDTIVGGAGALDAFLVHQTKPPRTNYFKRSRLDRVETF